jgi:hypothetical protein
MRFEANTFLDQPITLDDNEFIRCTFIRCEIIYKGLLPVTLENNRFDACNWRFEGSAALTVDFMTALYQGGGGGQQLIEATIQQIRSGRRRTSMPAPPGSYTP